MRLRPGVILLLLAVAACGDDGPLTAAERNERADEICIEVAETIDGLPQPADAAGVTEVATEAAEAADDGVDRLIDLVPDPEEDADGATTTAPAPDPFLEFVAAAQAAAVHLNALASAATAAGTGDPVAAQQAFAAATPALDALDQAAAQAQLAMCSSEAWGRVVFESAREPLGIDG